MTFGEIAQQSFIKNGILAPGESLPAELAQLALTDGNLLIEEFNIRDLMIWTTNINQYPLTARILPTYWYTIGPTGADFTAPRPLTISRANIVLTNSNPPSRFPLEIVNDMQWSDVTVPSLGSAPYPTKLYNNGDFPNSRLYLWPYPTSSGNALELFTTNQASEFTDVSDMFSFPPGYANAFMLTLAERLCEGFKAVSPSLAKSAAMARAYFGSKNSAAPKISTTDSGMPNGNAVDGPGNTFWNGWSNT